MTSGFVRFRNGAPAQRTNSNTSNALWGPFRGPSSSHIEPRWASVCLRSAELCGLGGSLMDLLDCAEDHRRGALDGPAHEVPWAVAVMYRAVTPCPHDGSHGKVEAPLEPQSPEGTAGSRATASRTAKPGSAGFPDVPFRGAGADQARPGSAAGGRDETRSASRPRRRPGYRLARDRRSVWCDQTSGPPALPAPPP